MYSTRTFTYIKHQIAYKQTREQSGKLFQKTNQQYYWKLKI